MSNHRHHSNTLNSNEKIVKNCQRSRKNYSIAGIPFAPTCIARKKYEEICMCHIFKIKFAPYSPYSVTVHKEHIYHSFLWKIFGYMKLSAGLPDCATYCKLGYIKHVCATINFKNCHLGYFYPRHIHIRVFLF